MTGDLDHDDVPEYHSTLEALDDVAAIVEAIVLSSASDEEREAYLVLADDYGSYAETLPEEQAERSQEQAAKLADLEKLMDAAFASILQACPDHIRKLHEAIRAAVDAEEASFA